MPLWLVALITVAVAAAAFGGYSLCAAAGRADERLGYKDDGRGLSDGQRP
jgi:hypothetical protein